MEDVVKIVNDIKAKSIKPVYFLMGEEPYYIDKLANYIESAILTEEEKGFNQTVLYGRDVTIEEVVSAARRFPMMSERQVIIVREAQDLSRTIENLESYVANPMPSTVLVICYKYKTLDKRRKLIKALEKNGVVFEGKKMYENQIPDWIRKTLAQRGYDIEPKAAAMLTEFLGTDLSKIANELDKLQIILPPKSVITGKHIEDNIGISKDFNNFELTQAVAQGNRLKAYQIVAYFTANPKDNPIVLTTSTLYSYFAQLLQFHALKDKSQKPAMAALKVNFFRFNDLQSGARLYPMKKVSSVIATIRDVDVKSKGVSSNASSGDLLKELLTGIFS